jgi:Fe-S cluster biosynthesis and repair protein YggX
MPILDVDNARRSSSSSAARARASPASRTRCSSELGARIYNEISKEAWASWLAHQTMLINENRLSPMDPKARKYLREQMQAFLFGGDADKVAGYVPE